MAEGDIEDVPFEPVEEKLDYIDELTGLSEPTGAMTFSSSSAIITIRDPVMHGMGRAIAVFILFICMFGFLNGLDYASPESGLIRPDEFVYRMSMGAPDESAVFQGMIYDDEGEPLANATIHISWDNGMTWKSNETLSDENGHFYLEHLDPGLARVDIIVERDGYRDVLANRVILSPPA
ncbi:MAG: carboxypeptidase regulatory-like domain-containing protein, partial [Euryarchaeota archaeon]|nr:carboxypeptidase regulatory-like domain-containing protein [Euryarchaeota archaeon]